MPDAIKLPELVGTLAQLPEHVRKVIVAYGAACARAAVLAYRERGREAPELLSSLPENCRAAIAAYAREAIAQRGGDSRNEWFEQGFEAGYSARMRGELYN